MVVSFYCSAVVVAQDQADNCSTTTFVDDILLPTMKQMVEQYQVYIYSVLSEQLFSHSYPTMGGSKSAWDISILRQGIVVVQPEVIWADGAGDSPCTHNSIKYWKAPQFLSWLYNDSPVGMTTVVNSR